MPHYKLIIAYDGTDYAGWQIQPNGIAIEQVLRESFARQFACDIWMLGASRTDAGVHARGQVVLCKTSLDITAQHLHYAWNRALPSTIVIRSCQRVDERFHPHVHVICKTYTYQLYTQRPLPFDARYGWHYVKLLDIDVLRQALRCFVGTHDFRALSKSQESTKDTIRTIESITLEKTGPGSYCITVRGQRFMHNMVRRIIGAAVQAAAGTITIARMQDIFASCNANNTLITAPAQGLTLQEIEYEGGDR